MRIVRVFSAAALVAPVVLGSGIASAQSARHIAGRHVDTEGRTLQDNCPPSLLQSGERGCFSHRILGFGNEPVNAPQVLSPQAACDPVNSGTYSTFQTWMLGATQIGALYQLTNTGTVSGNPPIVAIIDANGYSTAYADLTAYRAQFHLPPLPKCASATPGATACFSQVGQTGNTTNLPADDANWDGEQALDLDMVSAGCPTCSILLVDANSAGPDLNTALTYAAGVPGVVAISNSWGGIESAADKTGDAAAYSHPGVLIAAASGDQDYDDEGFSTKNGDTPSAPNYPASSPYVLAVGGTMPSPDATVARGFDEVVWSLGIRPTGKPDPADAATGTGSGCSKVFATPAWQTVAMGSCTKRGTNDVSAAADWNSMVPYVGPDGGIEINPVTGKPYHYAGIAVYQAGCWEPVGGTSAATPLVSAIFARYGFASKIAAAGAFTNVYKNASYFTDITSGNNDASGKCTDVMCTAGTGWDGPTGMGTPIGTAIAAAMGVGTVDAGAGSSSGGSSGSSSGSSSSGSGGSSSGGSSGGSSSGSSSGGSSSGNSSSGGDNGSSSSGGDNGSSSGGSTSDDAGLTGIEDGGVPLPEDGGNGAAGGGSSGGGCGCTSAPAQSAPFAPLLAVGAVLAFGVRRRRNS